MLIPSPVAYGFFTRHERSGAPERREL